MIDYSICVKEYVEDLRAVEAHGESTISPYEAGNYADAFEALLAENAKLKELYDKLDWERVKMKAERDDWQQKYLSSEVDATNLTGLLVQAVADIPRACGYCKWYADNGGYRDCHCNRLCENISGVNTQWVWRGAEG